jgi:orotidine-5'-phosphate decarboxylase
MQSFFEDLNFDSVTVALIWESSGATFFSFRKQTYYHVALTSNEGAFDFQTLLVDGKNCTNRCWKLLRLEK